MNNVSFIEKANILHNNKYDYSLVYYINSKTKIKIICKEHGTFEQMPYLHLQGHGCPICRLSYYEKFIEKVNILHCNKYDYSKVKYIDNNSKITIICPDHGEFNQTPNHHLKGFGCRRCSCSKGENIIYNILNNLNIKFEYQKKFNNCKNKRILPFDFYLIDYNICIEYDGRHHYESINYWGGDNKLEYTKNNDEIKTNYCKINNIELIRIKYDMKIKNIQNIFEKIKNTSCK
jgi:very-short-patch-repair endonuclease